MRAAERCRDRAGRRSPSRVPTPSRCRRQRATASPGRVRACVRMRVGKQSSGGHGQTGAGVGLRSERGDLCPEPPVRPGVLERPPGGCRVGTKGPLRPAGDRVALSCAPGALVQLHHPSPGRSATVNRAVKAADCPGFSPSRALARRSRCRTTGPWSQVGSRARRDCLHRTGDSAAPGEVEIGGYAPARPEDSPCLHCAADSVASRWRSSHLP